MVRAVFLDRDGVLNKAILREGRPHPPHNLEEFELLPGAREACEAFREAGFLLVVVTNQPDVACGTEQAESVELLNQTLRAWLPLDEIRTCFHDDSDGCSCRKPAPGLLLQAAAERNIDLGGSFMIGDRWKDIEAGRRAGCRTVLMDWGYAELGEAQPDFRARSLQEAAEWILSASEGRQG